MTQGEVGSAWCSWRGNWLWHKGQPYNKRLEASGNEVSVDLKTEFSLHNESSINTKDSELHWTPRVGNTLCVLAHNARRLISSKHNWTVMFGTCLDSTPCVSSVGRSTCIPSSVINMNMCIMDVSELCRLSSELLNLRVVLYNSQIWNWCQKSLTDLAVWRTMLYNL
jgi:hypothetical protein